MYSELTAISANCIWFNNFQYNLAYIVTCQWPYISTAIQANMVVTGIFLSAAAGGSNSSVLTADSEADNDMDQEVCCHRPRCHDGLTLHSIIHHLQITSICTTHFDQYLRTTLQTYITCTACWKTWHIPHNR